MSRWNLSALVIQIGCLLGGAISAYVVWKNVSSGQQSAHLSGRASVEPSPSDRGYEAMRLRLASVESQLERLGSRVISRDAIPPDGEQMDAEGSAQGAASEDAVALSEEQMIEESKKATAATFAYLEKRFADEPVSDSGAEVDVEAIRERFKMQEKFQLSRVECRYTMCRLELKGDVTSVAEIESVVDLRQGGTATKRDDGTVLVFTGRDGFPFYETNHPG